MSDCGTRTRARRVPQCPCPECRQVRRACATGHDNTTGALLTECWCQADALLVAQQDVLNGTTRSCGRHGCTPQ